MGDRQRSNTRRLYVPLVCVMTAMMATLLIAAAAGASAAEDQNQHGPNQHGTNLERIYGAMWVSPSLGDSYFASARDLSAAIERASSECERAATDCAQGVWVKNGFASLAMDVSGAWGTGWGKYEASANTAAVAACKAHGGVGCSVLQTERTAFYNQSGLTEGGTLPASAGSGAGGSAGTITPTPPPTPTPTPTPTPVSSR